MFVFFMVFCACSLESTSGDVRLISFPSKAGFVKDVLILEQELIALGFSTDKGFLPEMVDHVLKEGTYPVVDVQIFIQEFEEHLLPFGKKNYLIPNPEWCWDTKESLEKVDLVLARTREVERLYSDAGIPVYYLGFTGVDQYVEWIDKDYNEYFHLKGFSPHKSASEIVEAWLPSFPRLIMVDHWPNYKKVDPKISIISNYLTDEEVRWLQNRAGVHLCPSQTEGFGHYIAEAMSAGAVVITTDAPPMNEFITDKRFLVRPKEATSKQGWATLYHITPSELRKTIQVVRQIPKEVLKEVGLANRSRYLEMKSAFIERLDKLITESVNDAL